MWKNSYLHCKCLNGYLLSSITPTSLHDHTHFLEQPHLLPGLTTFSVLATAYTYNMYLLDIFSMTQFKFCTVAKLMEYKHLFLCCLLGSALSASALGPGRTLGLKAPYLSPDTPLPEAKWIDQKLDHFAPAGTTTYWKQRYFVNTTWFDGEGPVFLFLGGEGPASPAWLIAETNIMVMTRKFSGLAFYVEHRYDYSC